MTARMRVTVPSEAQARLIASLWGRDYGLQVMAEYIEPTQKVLLREGWIVPMGIHGTAANGWKWELHKVSSKGVRALHTYLVTKAHAYGATK